MYEICYLCTEKVPAPNALSKFHVISSSETLMCACDIDSSHQKPSNKMSNSTKTWSSSGHIRLLMAISFAFYVLTKSLQPTNYRKFTSLEARKPPMCDSDIDSSHQKPSNKMPNSPKTWSSSVRMRLLMTISFAIYVLRY